MKKKLIVLIFILLLVIISLASLKFLNKRKNYYQILKENMQDDIERVLYIVHPYCEVGSSSFSMTFEEEQNDYYGIDKRKLLDKDGKSYCKVQVVARCIDTNKLTWDTYLKCNNYKDEGFDGILKQDYNNIKNIIKTNLIKIMEAIDMSSSNPFEYTNNEFYINIVNLDRDAVDVIVTMYNNNELSSLEAYILSLAIQDITNCNLYEKYNLNWNSAEEFYELWKNNNCEFYK